MSCVQIHTARQFAVGIVYSFPCLFGMEQLGALAEQCGAQLQHSLMRLCVAEPAAVTWEDVKTYLQGVSCNNLQSYIPFLADVTLHKHMVDT